MLELDDFEKLKPILNHESFENEHPEDFIPRFKEVLPNFPDCVIEQWPYRHFQDFCSTYWWLDYNKLIFEKVKFNKEKILEIKTDLLKELDYWGADFVNNPSSRAEQTWLGRYMHDNKIFPRPIIVFNTIDNKGELSHKLLEPYQLLEGHMRLAYMRALITHKVKGVPEFHEVWLVKKMDDI